MCFTILTPCLSAPVKYTIKVDNITDIRGAIAGNQKSFLFLLPCIYNTQGFLVMIKIKLILIIKTAGKLIKNFINDLKSNLILTMNLASRRNMRNEQPRTIFRGYHCYIGKAKERKKKQTGFIKKKKKEKNKQRHQL